jgi:uncharacterized protein YhfF
MSQDGSGLGEILVRFERLRYCGSGRSRSGIALIVIWPRTFVAKKSEAAEAYWQGFVSETGLSGRYVGASFGDSPALADELLELVLSGRKRATASLARDYRHVGADPPPRAGDFVVWLDSSGNARCITRTTEVEVKPLSNVDDEFAWIEGEGDRSRSWWLDAHRRYFARQAEREGFAMDDGIETVFERFEVVWAE